MAHTIPPPRQSLDAISRLTADHQAVTELFANYFAATEPTQRKELIDRICTELVVHMALEEEIFYPAAQTLLDDANLVRTAKAEHAAVKALITRIQKADATHEQMGDWIGLLSELFRTHVEVEDRLLFPRMRGGNVDLVDLGNRIAQRQEELLSAGGPG